MRFSDGRRSGGEASVATVQRTQTGSSVQTPFCIRLAGGYPALTSHPGRSGGEPTFSHRNPSHRETLADFQFPNVRVKNPAFFPSPRSRSSTYRSQVEIDA